MLQTPITSTPPTDSGPHSLRTTSIAPSQINQQTAPSYTFEVYIDIVWAWLVAPIATIPFTILFLLSTIVKTWRAKIPAWKSSQLAALLALSPAVRDMLGGAMDSQGVMDEKAQEANTDVRLECLGSRRWELVRARVDGGQRDF